ncbi:amidohydrolase family protein [Kineococcus sp. SYSU DK002]|uniref:amidohydrolase family protein n=1 Tax=Kineococcus sp. SYSU DK002 TaxID=3383123 RepID=UPI003D7C6C85
MTFDLRRGPVDVHAHWLPQELFPLPPGAPFGALNDRDGRLFLGSTPLSIETRLMSDVAAVRADMDAVGIGARVLSAPPFAFARDDLPGSQEYVEAYNDALTAVVADGGGAFAGLGCVSLRDPGAAEKQMARLAETDGMVGIAIPPVLGDTSLDAEPLRSVLAAAQRHDLAVLVHPMQLPSPTLAGHYLANLIGNPVETATAVAAATLGGVQEALPDLRLCFVHGGGCAPALLGRWDHAWHRRPDVRADSARPPGEVFRSLHFDTVTHDGDVLTLLRGRAGAHRVLLGSDYPFDMADDDPVTHALATGLDREELESAARRFLRL